MMKKFAMTLMSILGVCTATACSSDNNKVSAEGLTILTPMEFRQTMIQDSAAYLLDVRRPEEFENGHLKGAALLNYLDNPTFVAGVDKLDKSKTIYVYCRSGRRSNEAARLLVGKGFKVVDMKGGFLAWEEAQLPTEK